MPGAFPTSAVAAPAEPIARGANVNRYIDLFLKEMPVVQAQMMKRMTSQFCGGHV